MTLVRRVWLGAKSLVIGLGVTGRHLFRKPVTLQYPHETPDVSHWGGPIELKTFPETGTHDCIACNACTRICPSECIDVEGQRPEGSKKMRATRAIARSRRRVSSPPPPFMPGRGPTATGSSDSCCATIRA
jgi:formate hydrogenlyase subunit 6/NADH:ubiquinone oxidoreductase subunit I